MNTNRDFKMNAQAADWYQVLGVDEKADTELIAQVYRFRVRKLHPDTGGDPEQMKLVNRAWEVLGSPESRAAYDAERARQTQPEPPQEQPVVPEPEYIPAPSAHRARLLPWSLVALWVALSAGTITYYAQDGEVTSVAVLSVGFVFAVAAMRQRAGGSAGAMWAMAIISALGTWMLWSSQTTEGLVLSWMMVAWTVLFVLSAEALAWRARR